MKLNISCTVIFTLLIIFSFSQGNIDHIINQSYLQENKKVDCNSTDLDLASARICANLAFQKSDSVLTVIYDSLLVRINETAIPDAALKIQMMQSAWRNLRDQHCRLVYDNYQGCSGCHERSIAYLYCLRELTDNRIKELRILYTHLLNE